MADNCPPVVIHNGSTTLKAGFAGEEAPAVIVPSTARIRDNSNQIPHPRHYRDRSHHLIQNGIIQKWDAMEQLWRRTLNDELLVPTERQPLLLTEIVMNPKACRQKTAQIVFESLAAPGLYLAVPSVLSLYTSGCLTGIGLSCGGDYTGLVPVYEGIALRRSAPFLPFAGYELDQYLRYMLHERGYEVDVRVARDIKEELCYAAFDYQQEAEIAANPDINRIYELPDGQIINIGQERYKVPEAMFNSGLLGLPPFRGLLGVHDLIARTTDVSIRSNLYENIVLSGGGCRFPGFSTRLKKEFEAMTAGSMTVNIVSALDPIYSAWIGGSMLASLSSFRDMVMTAQEYDEYGPSFIERKCF